MRLVLFIATVFFYLPISAKEYHVAKTGNDKNDGSFSSPLLTIQAAADLAKPGDIISVQMLRPRVDDI